MNHRIPTPDIRILTAICIIIFTLAAFGNAYRYIYKATPDYSFRIITEAAQQGDWEGFSAMVDDQTTAGQIFDSLAKQTTSAQEPQPILQLAWLPLKTEFTDNVHTYLAGRLTGDGSAAYSKAEKTLNDRLLNFGIPLPVNGWHYDKVSFARKIDKDTAEIDVTFHQDRLHRDLTGTFVMKRTLTNRWHITGVANLPTFLEKVKQAYDEELEAYNKPIADKINRTVKFEKLNAELLHSKNQRQTFLRIHFTPIYEKQNSPITEIKGAYELRRRDDNALLYYGEQRYTALRSGTAHTSQFLLNPLIPSQFALSQLPNLNNTTSSFTILSIHLADGTTYATANYLPEN